MANALIEFSNELANSVERGGASIVAVREGGRNGVSGTVWSKGVIVTAEHTIRGRKEVTVTLPSGKTAVASVAGRDPSTDIAVLQLAEDVLVVPDFADPGQLRPGNVVLALGRSIENGLMASYGVLSVIGGAWRTWQGGRIDQWLRLDLNPYPGFSGGPLVDGAGRVIGINTSGPRRTVLTIPRATVDRVKNQLLAKGRITRGYVGIGGQPVSIPSAANQKDKAGETRGLLVVTVASGGPAAEAGVMVGDIILSIEGNPIEQPADLLALLEPDTVGRTLAFHALRGGSAIDLRIKIGEREAE